MAHNVLHATICEERPVSGGHRSRTGFTLVETMMALLILVVLAGIVAMGLPVAMDTYKKAVNSSNAQMLLSTACTILRDEYGLSNDVVVKDGVVYYLSDEGYWASIDKTGADDDATARVKKRVYEGSIEYGSIEEVDGSPYEIVTDAMVTAELGITYASITYEDGLVTIAGLKVIDNEGNTLASTGSEADNELVVRTLLVDEEE